MGGIFSIISKLIWGDSSAQVQPQMNVGQNAADEMEELVAQAFGHNRVRCPWHGACFNTKTGDLEDFPGMDGLPVFDVRVEGDNVYVKGNAEEVRTSKRTRHMCAGRGDRRHFVIIGGGAAGASCAQSLRESGFAGSITVISKEHALPYDRPKLSKAMTVGLETIVLRSQQFWDQHGVEFLLGHLVTELDASTKTITLEDGKTFQYDACLVSTGGNPRALPVPQTSEASSISSSSWDNVYLLRDYDQAGVIDAQAAGKKVVIVGSSFIGMEIAAAISGKAASVTVVGMEKVPFERVLGMEVGEALQAMHASKGIQFHMQATVSDVEFTTDADGKAHASKLKLNTGAELDCDLICVGAGVVPATSFIKGVTLAKPDGAIICDEFMRVEGVRGLYAAGDIARYPLKMLNGRLVRIEHWGMALKQGQIAAKNMVADAHANSENNENENENNKNENSASPVAIDTVPYFWTAMYGKTVRYCGHGVDVTRTIVDGGASFDPSSTKFLIFYANKDGQIVATCSIARDPLVSICAELIHAGQMPSADEIQGAIDSSQSAEALLRSRLESVALPN